MASQPPSQQVREADKSTDYFYRKLAESNDWLTHQPATFSSEEGRPIPYLFLSSSSPTDEPTHSGNATKLKVYIQAAIHGDEPAGDQSVMALLAKMDANRTWAASLLERMTSRSFRDTTSMAWNISNVSCPLTSTATAST